MRRAARKLKVQCRVVGQCFCLGFEYSMEQWSVAVLCHRVLVRNEECKHIFVCLEEKSVVHFLNPLTAADHSPFFESDIFSRLERPYVLNDCRPLSPPHCVCLQTGSQLNVKEPLNVLCDTSLFCACFEKHPVTFDICVFWCPYWQTYKQIFCKHGAFLSLFFCNI